MGDSQRTLMPRSFRFEWMPLRSPMPSPLESKNEDGISDRRQLISTTHAERVSLDEPCCSQGKDADSKGQINSRKTRE